MFASELKSVLRPIPLVVTVAMLTVPLGLGIGRLMEGVVRDNFDTMAQLLVPPTGLLLPLAAAVIGCSTTAGELRHRYLANTRVRISAHELVRAKLLAIGVHCGVPFFLYAYIPFTIAYVLWPALGNPHVDPGSYLITPEQAAADALTRTSYSQFLRWGPLCYAILYSLWLALGGITLASLTLFLLLFTRSLPVALAAPFLVYFGQTVAAQVLGYPRAALSASLIPFGLTQGPVVLAAAPMLALTGVTIALWGSCWHRLPTSERLV